MGEHIDRKYGAELMFQMDMEDFMEEVELCQQHPTKAELQVRALIHDDDSLYDEDICAIVRAEHMDRKYGAELMFQMDMEDFMEEVELLQQMPTRAELAAVA